MRQRPRGFASAPPTPFLHHDVLVESFTQHSMNKALPQASDAARDAWQHSTPYATGMIARRWWRRPHVAGRASDRNTKRELLRSPEQSVATQVSQCTSGLQTSREHAVGAVSGTRCAGGTAGATGSLPP